MRVNILRMNFFDRRRVYSQNVVDEIYIPEGAVIQAKNSTGGSNYTALVITVW